MSGCIKIFNYKNAPVYVHWTILLVMLFFVNKPDPFITIPFGLIGFFIIMLTHEMGHAFFVHFYGYKVDHIVLSAMNGQCVYEYDQYKPKKLLISAGGIIFQLILMLLWFVFYSCIPEFETGSFSRIIATLNKLLIFMNLLIIIVNLIPKKGLDGYDIFQILLRKFINK